METTDGGIDRPGCSSLPFVRSDLMALWKVVRSRIGAGGVCVWVHFWSLADQEAKNPSHVGGGRRGLRK